MLIIFHDHNVFRRACLKSLVLTFALWAPISGYSEEIMAEQNLFDLVKQQQKC